MVKLSLAIAKRVLHRVNLSTDQESIQGLGTRRLK